MVEQPVVPLQCEYFIYGLVNLEALVTKDIQVTTLVNIVDFAIKVEKLWKNNSSFATASSSNATSLMQTFVTSTYTPHGMLRRQYGSKRSRRCKHDGAKYQWQCLAILSRILVHNILIARPLCNRVFTSKSRVYHLFFHHSFHCRLCVQLAKLTKVS